MITRIGANLRNPKIPIHRTISFPVNNGQVLIGESVYGYEDIVGQTIYSSTYYRGKRYVLSGQFGIYAEVNFTLGPTPITIDLLLMGLNNVSVEAILKEYKFDNQKWIVPGVQIYSITQLLQMFLKVSSNIAGSYVFTMKTALLELPVHRGNPPGVFSDPVKYYKREVNTFLDVADGEDTVVTSWTPFMQAGNMTLQSTCEPFTTVLKCLQQLTKCMFAMYGVETNSQWARLAIMNKYNHRDAKISGHTDDNQYYQMTSLDNQDMCLISSLSLFAKRHLVDSTFNRFYIRNPTNSNKVYNLKLPDMSLTILDGGLYHGVVARRKHDTNIPRINITFRTPRQDCPDIGEMGIANHNRYYGRPVELLVPKDLNTAVTQKQLETWKQYCQEEAYDFRVTRLTQTVETRAHLKKQFVLVFKDWVSSNRAQFTQPVPRLNSTFTLEFLSDKKRAWNMLKRDVGPQC